MDPVRLKWLLACFIIGLASVAASVIIVWDAVHGATPPGYVLSFAGVILGFAIHQIGVSTGVTVGASTIGEALNAEEAGTQTGARS